MEIWKLSSSLVAFELNATKDLERYSTNLLLRLENDALVYEIREEMYKTKQDDMTVAQYLVVFGKN